MSDGMFPNHGPEGAWSSLKGAMLAPHIAPPLESTSQRGASRANSPSPSIAPNSTIQVDTPLTMGGGSFAK